MTRFYINHNIDVYLYVVYCKMLNLQVVLHNVKSGVRSRFKLKSLFKQNKILYKMIECYSMEKNYAMKNCMCLNKV